MTRNGMRSAQGTAAAALLLLSGCVGMPGYGALSVGDPGYSNGYGYAPAAGYAAPGYAPGYGYAPNYAYAPGYAPGYAYSPGYYAAPAAGFGGVFFGGGGGDWRDGRRYDGGQAQGDWNHGQPQANWRREGQPGNGHPQAQQPPQQHWAQPQRTATQPHWAAPQGQAGSGSRGNPWHPPAGAAPQGHMAENRSGMFPQQH